MADHHTQNVEHNRYYYEDEIELMDLLKVIWKWKYLILAGTVICAVGAALISLQMPKVYRVDMSLAPGLLRIKDDGTKLYIDSLENLQTFIETGTLDQQIIQGLKLPRGEARPESLGIKVKRPKGLNVVEVSYETANPELGIEILKDLSVHLRERYLNDVTYHKQVLDVKQEQKNAELISVDNAISNTKARIMTTREKMKTLKDEQRRMKEEISRISKNTDVLISQRDEFLSSKQSEENALSSLLYSNTIQQYISYLNSLKGMASGIKNEMYELQLEIDELQNAIKDLESKKGYILEEVHDLEMREENVQNIQILQPPQKKPHPIKPKTKLNAMLTAVVSLFLTLFLSFFVEYIVRYKRGEMEREPCGETNL